MKLTPKQQAVEILREHLRVLAETTIMDEYSDDTARHHALQTVNIIMRNIDEYKNKKEYNRWMQVYLELDDFEICNYYK